MHRNLKLISLLMAVAFAISGVATSVASAAEIHSASAPTTIKGVQKTSLVLTTNAGTVTCKTATYTGTQSTVTTSTENLTPDFTGCTAFGFLQIPVDVNNCRHIISASGASQIDCPSGKAVEITVPFCTTSIGAQTFSSGIVWTTEGFTPKRFIITDINISGMTYNECGTIRNNGVFTGDITFSGSAGELWYL